MSGIGRQPKDLTGQIFGYLTAIEMQDAWYQDSRVWLCKCVCGQEVYFSARELGLAGKPRKPSDEGIVLDNGEVYYANRWTDHCGCGGGETTTPKSPLSRRLTLDGFAKVGGKRETISQRYSGYKYGAKTRNYNFELTIEQFHSITQQACTYCGKIAEPFNGVDRSDNDIGYTMENSVPCCDTCNRMKQAMHKDEFVHHCKKIATFTAGSRRWRCP